MKLSPGVRIVLTAAAAVTAARTRTGGPKDDGPKILEINSSPGLEGIERTSGVDVAGAIVAHAEKFFAKRRKRGSRGRDRDAVVEAEQRSARLRSEVERVVTRPSMVRRARAGG